MRKLDRLADINEELKDVYHMLSAHSVVYVCDPRIARFLKDLGFFVLNTMHLGDFEWIVSESPVSVVKITYIDTENGIEASEYCPHNMDEMILEINRLSEVFGSITRIDIIDPQNLA